MARVDSHSHIPTAVFIDALKLFQKHPEQFSLDLRAKFCGCTGSKGTSSVCSEYSKQTKLKEMIHQKSAEFISIANEPNNNLQMLINATEELKLMLQSRSKDSRRSSTYQDVNVMRIIDFLITNPEKRFSSVRKHMNIPKTVTPAKSISHERVLSTSTTSHKSYNSASCTCHSKSEYHKYSKSKKKHYSMTTLSTGRSHLKNYRSRRKGSRSSFRSTKRNIRSSKEPFPKKSAVSDTPDPNKTNEEQVLKIISKRQLTFSAVVQPALTKREPIPFVIVRLCCPPDMIPLTGKVAQRLGLNIKMAEPTINGILCSIP